VAVLPGAAGSGRRGGLSGAGGEGVCEVLGAHEEIAVAVLLGACRVSWRVGA